MKAQRSALSQIYESQLSLDCSTIGKGQLLTFDLSCNSLLHQIFYEPYVFNCRAGVNEKARWEEKLGNDIKRFYFPKLLIANQFGCSGHINCLLQRSQRKSTHQKSHQMSNKDQQLASPNLLSFTKFTYFGHCIWFSP